MPQVGAPAHDAEDGAAAASTGPAAGLSVSQLRERLKELGLPPSGTKAELAARFEAAVTGGVSVADGTFVEAQPMAEEAAPEKKRRAPKTRAQGPADPVPPAEPKRRKKASAVAEDAAPALAPAAGGADAAAASAEAAGGGDAGAASVGEESTAPQAAAAGAGDAGAASAEKEPAPQEPNTPAALLVPSTPAALLAPGTPAAVGAPNTLAALGAPNTPAALGAPSTPAGLAPGTPAAMGAPNTPAALGAPSTPAGLAPGTPAALGAPSTPAALGAPPTPGGAAATADVPMGDVEEPEAEKAAGFKVGDTVEAWYKGDDWFQATLAAENEDGSFVVEWASFHNDEDVTKRTKAASELRKQDDRPKDTWGDSSWQKDWNEESANDQKESGWDVEKWKGDEKVNSDEKWKRDDKWRSDENAEVAEWNPEMYFPDPDENQEEDDAAFEFREWPLREAWQEWEPNSKESMTATFLVQKIRARTQASWEQRLKVSVTGFAATTAKVNGVYAQAGMHESRPFYQNPEGGFFMYCSGKTKWCIAPELGAEDPQAWAYFQPPADVEGQVRVKVPRLAPDGEWEVNLAYASGKVMVSKPEPVEEAFPNKEVLEAFNGLVGQRVVDQRSLVAALQWIAANVLEVKTVPPGLNDGAMQLVGPDSDSIRTVVSRVPGSTLLAKANAPIPPPSLRQKALDIAKDFVPIVYEKLGGDAIFGEAAKFQEIVDDVLGGMPMTVRLQALVHAYEFAHLKDRPYRDPEDVAIAFAKLCLLDRAAETTSRLTLGNVIGLIDEVLAAKRDDNVGQQAELYRAGKISVLNRLYTEWQVTPSEEELSRLHYFSVTTQLTTLLLIEREVERYWAKVSGSTRGEAERAAAMREYLVFEKLLLRHLSNDDPKVSEELENESRKHCEMFELARVRKSVSDVLRKLKTQYGWSPSLSSRIKMSKTNWVARLSALLFLANAEACVDADLKLRVLLQQESSRKLGSEVLTYFDHWHSLQVGEGLSLKTPRTVAKDRAERIEQMYNDYQSDSMKRYGPQGYQPFTPFGLPGAQAPGTPRGGGMTPVGQWFASRTPAGAPPATPFMVAGRTPAGAPPATPATFRPPRTPAGPPPQTPFTYFRPPGTPGYPPPSPGNAGTPSGAPPLTPGRPSFGVPQTPGAVPSTPAAAFGAPVPSTPAAAFAAAGRVPQTPNYAAGAMTPAPQTPGFRVPSTPRALGSGAAPSTPGAVPFTPGNVVPNTPAFKRFAPPSTPGAGSAVPMTPAAAFAGAGAVPGTPCGALPFTPGLGGAMPFTPRPGGSYGAVPSTPVGFGAVPSTPGGAVPFTPGAAVPFTPMPPRR